MSERVHSHLSAFCFDILDIWRIRRLFILLCMKFQFETEKQEFDYYFRKNYSSLGVGISFILNLNVEFFHVSLFIDIEKKNRNLVEL